MVAKDLPSPFISLVTPTYNQRENLPSLVERVDRNLQGYDYELIIVDDNSPDGTTEVAESLSHKYPIKLICRKGERGLASAAVTGFNQARGEVVGLINADLGHPPEKIPELLKAIEDGADIAIASRNTAGGRNIKLARLVLPSIKKIRDPLSGFFFLKRKVIEGVELKPRGYGVLLEALTRKGSEVREVLYIEEESALSYKEQLSYLGILILATRERELRRFVQFCLVGLSGVGVNFGTFWLLTRGARLWDLAAVILSWAAATLSNFVWNEVWTFRDRGVGNTKAMLVRAMKFFLVSLGAMGLYYAVYTPLTRFLGVYDLVAYAIAIGIGLVWNFSANVLWTWRKSEKGRLLHS